MQSPGLLFLLKMAFIDALASGFLWVPLLLVAYWIGRRQLNMRAISFFVAAEALALLAMLKLWPYPSV